MAFYSAALKLFEVTNQISTPLYKLKLIWNCNTVNNFAQTIWISKLQRPFLSIVVGTINKQVVSFFFYLQKFEIFYLPKKNTIPPPHQSSYWDEHYPERIIVFNVDFIIEEMKLGCFEPTRTSTTEWIPINALLIA